MSRDLFRGLHCGAGTGTARNGALDAFSRAGQDAWNLSAAMSPASKAGSGVRAGHEQLLYPWNGVDVVDVVDAVDDMLERLELLALLDDACFELATSAVPRTKSMAFFNFRHSALRSSLRLLSSSIWFRRSQTTVISVLN